MARQSPCSPARAPTAASPWSRCPPTTSSTARPGSRTGKIARAAPRTAYGRTKLAGERAVLAALPSTGYVVRTAWLYGAHGHNFVTTMIGCARTASPVSVVDDQRGQPTWTADLARQIGALVTARAPAGVYHATSSGEITWFGLAREVFALPGAIPALVSPVTSDAFPRPAPRPAYSVLGHDAWAAADIKPIGDWRDALARRSPPCWPVTASAAPPRRRRSPHHLAGRDECTVSSRFLSQTIMMYWPTRYSRSGLPKTLRTPASGKAYALPDPGMATTKSARDVAGIVPGGLGDPRVRELREVGDGVDVDPAAGGQRGAARRPVLGEPAGQVVGHQPVGEALGLGRQGGLGHPVSQRRQVTGQRGCEQQRQREPRAAPPHPHQPRAERAAREDRAERQQGSDIVRARGRDHRGRQRARQEYRQRGDGQDLRDPVRVADQARETGQQPGQGQRDPGQVQVGDGQLDPVLA